MKLIIKLEVASDEQQVPPDKERPYNNTLRYSDVYQQTLEIPNTEAAKRRVDAVIKAFNEFTQ